MKTATQTTTSNLKAHILVFMGAFCISFAAFFVKDAPIDPSMVAFYRLFFGGITLFAVAAIRREKLLPPKPVLRFILAAGLLFACDLLAWHDSIVLVGPGIATILTNFQVLILAIYGVVVLKEKFTRAQKIAMPLALVGLALLLGLHENVLPPHIVKGVMLCLLSAVFYSGYILTLRQSQTLTVRIGPVANMAWVSLIACLCVGLFCGARGLAFAIPDARTLVFLALLGIVCQSLGWVLLSLGIPYLPPSRSGLILLTQPALAFTWDVIFYGTAAGPINILGAVLAIAAIGMGILAPTGPKKSGAAEPPEPLRASMHPAGESVRLRSGDTGAKDRGE